MKRIGKTNSGSVIVEMSLEEFEALERFQNLSAPAGKKASAPASIVPKSGSERLAYISERLAKLSPKKRDGVVRSIAAMFQFSGGIEAGEIDKIIAALNKSKFFTISADGKVTYTRV